MRVAKKHEFTGEQKNILKKAKVWEYVTVAYLICMVFLMYIVMGNSQAMKAAWVEDMLSLLPPLTFLLANRFSDKAPSRHFPYGFHRSTTLGFLVASLALLSVGSYLLYDSLSSLILMVHPTIGMKEYFGFDIWLGWWMILVNLLGIVPPVILGLYKMKLAEPINDKILYTDSEMNKADWMTASATIAGIIGIGMGWWWADGLAASFISLSILKDGFAQSKDAFSELLNRPPKNLQGDYIDLPEKIKNIAAQVEWIEKVQVRMREEGHIVLAEVFVQPSAKITVTPILVERLQKELQEIDWKLHEVLIIIEPL